MRRLIRIKEKAIILWVALRHPGTPFRVKLILIAVFIYILSPIDLVPDAIPFAGLVEDLLLLPLGIHLAHKQIPDEVRTECETQSEDVKRSFTWIIVIAVLVLLVWIAATVAGAYWIYHRFFAG